MPRCTDEVLATCYKSELERSVDLARVGVASDGDALYVAASAHGRFTSPETAVNYGVFIDTDGDGVWDRQVTTTRIADFDAPLVVVTDREFNLLPADDPYVGFLNVADGTVDTNAFDSDVQVLAAPLSVLGITGRVSFGVQATSAYNTVDDLGTTTGETGPELAAEPMSFDPTAPGLTVGLGQGPAVLETATDGTTLTVTQDPASYAADVAVGGEKGALVVLHQNDTATGRAQSVPIAGLPVPSTEVTTTAPTSGGSSAPPSSVVTEPPAAEPPAAVESPAAAPTGTGTAPATSAPATTTPAG